METGQAHIESSGLMSYQQSNAENGRGQTPKLNLRGSFMSKGLLVAAAASMVMVLCCAQMAFGTTKTSSLQASMASALDDIPPPPPPPPGVPPPPADPAAPAAPVDPNAPPAPAAPAAPAGPAPPGPPPITACQTGMVADAVDVPEDNNEMKACYLICDNTPGATPCDVSSCKSACWFGNDFCYNSCMGGCQYQAVGLTNGSRMACDGQTCFSGCSYQCQKQCNCGVQKNGHCLKAPTTCMLDESIPGQVIGDTVNYICSNGPSAVRKLCAEKHALKAACRSGFGMAVALVSYYYSYVMSTTPQVSSAGISSVAAACDFDGFGFIKSGNPHPCSLNYKGYAGTVQPGAASATGAAN